MTVESTHWQAPTVAAAQYHTGWASRRPGARATVTGTESGQAQDVPGVRRRVRVWRAAGAAAAAASIRVWIVATTNIGVFIDIG